MSFLRKMYAQVRLTPSDVPANEATVRIMRPGCRVTGGAEGFAYTDNPGALYGNAKCYFIDSSGNAIAGSQITINLSSNDGVAWDASEGKFKIRWDLGSPSQTKVPVNGERIVFDPVLGGSGSFSSFYQTDTGADTPINTSFDLPASGKIEGYVKTRDVDIFVSYNSSDTYIVDVTTEQRDYTTPEDFGAQGSGGTSDYPAFQNALDYLSYVALGGELKCLGQDYNVQFGTQLIVNGDGVTISGHGPATDLQYDGANETMIQVADGVNDFTIRDIQLSHTSGGTEDETQGLLTIGSSIGTSGCKRIKVSNVTVKARYSSGIALYGVQGFTLIGNTISNGGGATGGHGIAIWNANGPTSKRGIISACQLYDDKTVAGNAGIFIDDIDRIIVSDCSVRGWSYGVRFGEGSNGDDLSIDSCHIREQAAVGIYHAGSTLLSRIVISGNTIDTCGDQGIYLNSSNVIRSPVITGNTVSNTGKSGMVFDGCAYGRVTGNVISEVNTDNYAGGASALARLEYECGIGIDVPALGMAFNNNTIVGLGTGGNAEYGFVYSDGITGIISFGNTILGAIGTADHYPETTADMDNCAWLNHDEASDDFAWGSPMLTKGLLKSDGGIDTNGADIDLGGGELINAVIASTSKSYGAIYMVTPAAVADSGSIGTFVKINGTVASTAVTDVDFAETTTSGGMLTYNGASTKVFKVDVAFSMTGTGGQQYSFKVAKNQTVIDDSEVKREMGTPGTDLGAAAISCLVSLANGDDLELYLDCDSANDSAGKVETMNFSVIEV